MVGSKQKHLQQTEVTSKGPSCNELVPPASQFLGGQKGKASLQFHFLSLPLISNSKFMCFIIVFSKKSEAKMEFLIIVFPQQGLSAVIQPFIKNMYYSLYHLLYPIDSGYAGAEHRGLNGNQNKTERKILSNPSNLIKLVGGKPDFILMVS